MLKHFPFDVRLLLVLLLWVTEQSWAEPLPTACNYQGQLKLDDGIVDGATDFAFTLWDAAGGGNPVGATVMLPGVDVVNGLFSVPLDFGPDALDGQAHWLSVSVRHPAGSGGFVELTPRQLLTPVPYALALPALKTLPNPTSPNILAGWSENYITDGSVGATVSGGGAPLIGGNPRPNRVTENYGTVSGGSGNRAGNSNADLNDANHATVGGGYANDARGTNSTIAGGWGNQATNNRATVGGGWNNLASGDAATISGGRDNKATGSRATVGGGMGNQATGSGAMISGGYDNLAEGICGFAAGRRARAAHAGAFVWGDYTDAEFASTANNQFLIRAGGGVGIGTNNPTSTLTVAGTVESTSGGIKFPDGTVQATAGSGLGLTLPYSGYCSCFDPRDPPPAFDVTTGSGSVAIQGTHEATASQGQLGGGIYGVRGTSAMGISGSPPSVGAGVLGLNTGSGHGIRGESSGGTGVRGEGGIGVAGVGTTYGVYGQSASGHAAYLDGDVYIAKDVGIATTNPQNPLDVRGPGTNVGGNIVSEVVARFRKSGGGHSAVSVDADSGQDAILYWAEGGNAHWDIRHDVDVDDSLNVRYHGGTAQNESMARFLPDGTTRVRILEIVGGSDLAEPFVVSRTRDEAAAVEPGMVVVIDPDTPGGLTLSSEPYDRKVAGVISGAKGLKPGMVMKAEDNELATGDHPVALTGRVWCRCDTSTGPITPGDLLTTGRVPGHAMRVADHTRAQGAVLGKAMTSLSEGTGLVLVLVTLQ